jgi:hypothetical protein
MSATTTKKAISFWELILEHKIEIPIIQRDYAQGRDDDKTKKIRNGFLKSIIDSLQSESSSLELDFVYGNVVNDVLQPLDGQQRLTTLFLLHWFVALKTDKLSENKSAFLRFTYETRISSREFYNELAKNWNDLGEGETVAEKIADSKWFVLSWKKDPTIKAMLTMLDAIEEKLKNIDVAELILFWKKLTSEKPPITFNFKELNDIGLTDDLYIKMNARGKSLTEFENFKARFEKYIKESNCDKIDWEIEYKDKPTETFSHKVDTIWTDLFWKHRGNDNLIDNEFIKFISGIAITNYAQNLEIIDNSEDEEKTRKSLEGKSKDKTTTVDAVKRERIERKVQLLFNSPAEVNPDDFPTKKAFDYLVSCLDHYSNGTYDEILPNDLPLWDYCKKGKADINSITKIDNNLFVEFIKNSETTYKQRVLFFAQTQFLLNPNEYNQEFFSNWMRVIRNIVQNITIDSAAGYIGAIGLINELSRGSLNIYEYLAKNEVKSGVASNQTSEEKLKAGLILSKDNWKSQIFKVEDDSFLQGEIKFLLDYSKTANVFIYEKFETLTDIYLLLFESKDDLLRRALLTQDDYPIWDGYTYLLETHRYSLLHSDNEWKNAFRKSSGEFTNAVLKLLSYNHNITEERFSILNNIIQNAETLDDYRHHLVNNIKLLTNCYHKRFCVSDKALYVLEKTKVVGDNYKKIKL